MIQGEHVLNTLSGLERVWNRLAWKRDETDTQRNVNFEILHSMVWNGGVWNGIRGLVPDLWIGVWIGMCVSPCSGRIHVERWHYDTCQSELVGPSNIAHPQQQEHWHGIAVRSVWQDVQQACPQGGQLLDLQRNCDPLQGLSGSTPNEP